MLKRDRLTLILAVFVFPVAIAGCGSKDDSASSKASAPASQPRDPGWHPPGAREDPRRLECRLAGSVIDNLKI